MQISDAINALLGYSEEKICRKTELKIELAKLEKEISLGAKREKTYVERLKQYDSMYYNLEKSEKEKIDKILQLETEITSKNLELVSKDASIQSLQCELAKQGGMPTTCPDWLDESKPAYKPYLQIPNTSEGYSMQNPRNIYSQSNMLDEMIDISNSRKLSKYEKLALAWKFTIGALVYEADKGDNWQTHIMTITRKKGDCDDGSILFEDICWALGIRADQTFNVCGPTSFGYHSYPISWLSNEDVKNTALEGKGNAWYIYETTIDSVPSKPIKLMKSNYWVDSMANWKYAGQPRDKNEMFNGIPGGEIAGSNLEMRIEHGSVKRGKINEYWKKEMEGG